MRTLDFQNENSLRCYPVKDGLTRISTGDLFTIPNDLIVDLVVTASAPAATRFYISRVVHTADSLACTVSDDSGVAVGTFYVDLAVHTTGKDYYMTASPDYVGANGRVTLWETVGLAAQALGSFDFTLATAELCMRCFIPSIATLSRIRFVDAAGTDQTLTGNVTVQAESNLRFRYEAGILYLDAGEGLGLNRDCGIVAAPIKSINGVFPDSNGDFMLVPSDCAEFEPITNGLLLKDLCGKPCVGCAELSALTDRATAVETDMINTKGFIDGLNLKISQLTTLATYTYDCNDCS